MPVRSAALRKLEACRAHGGRVHARGRAADEVGLLADGPDRRGDDKECGQEFGARHHLFLRSAKASRSTSALTVWRRASALRNANAGLKSCATYHYFVTTTVTLSYVNTDPSLATARSTYVPGSAKLGCATHFPSGGGSGIVYGGDHGEFAYARVSVHVFI